MGVRISPGSRGGVKGTNGAQALREVQKTKAAPDIPGNLVIDIGFNLLVDKAAEMDRKWWGSKSVGLYYTFNIAPKNLFFSINPGIGVGLEKYALDDDITLVPAVDDEIGRISVIDTLSEDLSVRKSKIATNYFEIPLEFRFYTNQEDRERGVFFALGASAGVLFQQQTKLSFTEDGLRSQIKNRTDFQFNQFRARGIARFGYRGVNVFFKFGITEWFQSGRGPSGAPATMHTIGFSFVGF